MSVSAGPAAIAMVDLNPLLDETEPAWRKHIHELRDRMQFVLGEQVRQFEEAFAHHLGASACVGCGSGTSAIELCLRAAKVTRPSQKVLVPAFTSPFTAQAIFAAGARPIFCDVDPETLLLDPALAEEQFHKAVTAIVPVHLYGQPCDLPQLQRLAQSRGAVLVQDACQAHGARCSDAPLTRFSEFVAYSFYPTKNLGCLGDGGAVATNSSEIADCLRLLRDGGRHEDQLSRVVAVNSRLDEVQACFLRAFLPRLENWNQERSRLADVYDSALAGCADIRPVRRSASSVNHLYVIRAPRRKQLREALLREGVQTGVHYPVPLHLHPAFSSREVPKGSFPNAEGAAGEVLSLPLRPHLGESSALRVAELIWRFYR
jgi:dTDP-3-amino-3,4,6-trideoxy-alpha-D-glucose transaminase